MRTTRLDAVTATLVLVVAVALTACEAVSSAASRLTGDRPAPRAAPGRESQVLYTYRGPGGRTTLVNGSSLVPPAYRAHARKLDISRVSLNEEVGNDLAQEVELELARLRASEPCGHARRLAARGPLWSAWDRHAPLMVVGVALFLLLVFTPSMLRLVGALWARTLLWLIPLLGTVGIMAWVGVNSTRMLGIAQTAADLCTESAPNAPAASLAQRIDRVSAINNALAEIDREAGYRVTSPGVSSD